MIRPVLETLSSALLIAASAFIFFFGPNGLVVLAYSAFSPETKRWLWEAFPPERLNAEWSVKSALAGVVLMAGLLVAAGLLAAYPTWRKGFVALTAALLVCVGIQVALVF
jgi:hypothetical protein